MGITESKILTGKLASACSSAEQNKQGHIQHVLLDKQFVECLATLWDSLPGPSKDKITGRKRRRSGPKKVKNQIDRQIGVPALLKPNLRLWAKESKSFLNPIPYEEPVARKACPVAMFYQQLSTTEIRNTGDVIRSRFLKVLFHHLKDRFCITYLRPDAVTWLAKRVGLAGLDDGDTVKISGKIKDWTYLGGRYDALCRDIGKYNVAGNFKYLGNLMRLPDDVSDRYVRKELKVKGPDRTREVKSLMCRGVYQPNQENGAIDSLADTIFKDLWGLIEPYVPPEEAELGTVFYSLKDWRELPGTRVIRLQIGDSRTQVENEEEHHISAQLKDLSTRNQSTAHVRALDRCDTLSPSAEIDEIGSVDLQLSGTSGPSSFHGTSDPAGSDVSEGSTFYCGDTPISNPLTERDSAGGFSPEVPPTSNQPLECPPISEPEGTQQMEPILAQPTFATSARRNQNKRKRNHFEHSGEQNDALASQKTSRFDIATAGGRREQNDTFPNGIMSTATAFPTVIQGGTRIGTNSINGAYWPSALDEGSLIGTNNAEWPQSTIDMNSAALSELAFTGPTSSDHTNIPTANSHNELYTLFDHNYTSAALPTPMLWSLFPP